MKKDFGNSETLVSGVSNEQRTNKCRVEVLGDGVFRDKFAETRLEGGLGRRCGMRHPTPPYSYLTQTRAAPSSLQTSSHSLLPTIDPLPSLSLRLLRHVYAHCPIVVFNTKQPTTPKLTPRATTTTLVRPGPCRAPPPPQWSTKSTPTNLKKTLQSPHMKRRRPLSQHRVSVHKKSATMRNGKGYWAMSWRRKQVRDDGMDTITRLQYSRCGRVRTASWGVP